MTEFNDTQLIIIRGPSGAGKSTITEQLMKTVTRPTAHIDQDSYRFILEGMEKEQASDLRHEMILSDTLIALRRGCDVIFQGILGMKGHRTVFQKLFEAHPENNFAFFLEASFDETVRRHASRPKANEFPADDMAEWYDLAQPLGIENEVIIPESSVLADSIATIRRVAGI